MVRAPPASRCPSGNSRVHVGHAVLVVHRIVKKPVLQQCPCRAIDLEPRAHGALLLKLVRRYIQYPLESATVGERRRTGEKRAPSRSPDKSTPGEESGHACQHWSPEYVLNDVRQPQPLCPAPERAPNANVNPDRTPKSSTLDAPVVGPSRRGSAVIHILDMNVAVILPLAVDVLRPVCNTVPLRVEFPGAYP